MSTVPSHRKGVPTIEKHPAQQPNNNESPYERAKPLSRKALAVLGGIGGATLAACSFMGFNIWRDLNPEESTIVAGVPGRIEQAWHKNEGCVTQVGAVCAQENYVQVVLMTQCPQDVAAVKAGVDVYMYSPVVATDQDGCVVDEFVATDGERALRVGMIFTPGSAGDTLYRPS